MKNINVKNQVMLKIADFEEKQSKKKLYGLRVFIVFFGVLFLIFAIQLYIVIQDQQLSDLFELFREDAEVISLYWTEVLNTLYLELPKGVIIGIFISIVMLIFLYIGTKKRRKFLAEKLERVYKYKSIHPKRGNL